MNNIIKIDREKLTKGFFIPGEFDKTTHDQLKGLIDSNICFSAIVYGCRGTGKTSLINYVLDEYDKKRIIIRFNATKYYSYNSFLKRFIREFYYSVNEHLKPLALSNKEREKILCNLENIFKHTFFDIKETSKSVVEASKSTERSFGFSRNLDYEKVFDFSTLFALVFAIGITRFNFNFADGSIKKLLFAFFISAVLLATVKVAIKVGLQKLFTKTRTKKTSTESAKLEESLYDDEIAEYHVFNELKRISTALNQKIIIVLDELDKLDKNKVEEIIRDLKPIIVSDCCSTIMVGGMNFDERLVNEKDEPDGITKSLFSQKIYVPLADSQKSERILNSLVLDDPNLKGEAFKLYKREKILNSKGVVRNLLNSIISDIDWQNGNPYINLDKHKKNIEITNWNYSSLNSIEEYIDTSFTDDYKEKIDEIYILSYKVCDYIKEQIVKDGTVDKNFAVRELESFYNKLHHLDRDDCFTVIDLMFGDIDETKLTLKDMISDNTPKNIDVIERIVANIWKDSSPEAKEQLKDATQYINNLFTLYSEKLQVEKGSLLSMFYGLEIKTDKELKEAKTFAEGVKLVGFSLINLELVVKGISDRYAREHSNDSSHVYTNYSAFILFYLGIVSESLFKIYFWSVNPEISKYDQLESLYSQKFDIEYKEGNLFRAFEIKLQRRASGLYSALQRFVNQSINDLQSMNIQNAKITLIMYVPNAEPELFEDCNTYIENYSQKTNPNSNLHFEARFIPVNSQEDFNNGLNKIIL